MEDVDVADDVVIDQEGVCIQTTDKDLDCLAKNVARNGAFVPQVVDSFLSDVEEHIEKKHLSRGTP